VSNGPAARVIGVAVELPEPYGSDLRRWRARLGDEQAHTVPTHVTLLPPTTVDAELLPEIEAHLEAVAEGQPPFQIRLRGTGTFRPVSPVVFVTLVDGISGCERLERAVRSGVLWRPLHFPYHPHVTVAHGLPEASLDAAFAALGDYDGRFTVDRFHLYEHDGGAWVLRRDFPFG
jgi:2'-5' RNA ligase